MSDEELIKELAHDYVAILDDEYSATPCNYIEIKECKMPKDITTAKKIEFCTNCYIKVLRSRKGK